MFGTVICFWQFLGDVSNGALRDLVEKMAAAGLSAKTIVNYSQVVKLVVASAVDSMASRFTRANGITILSGCPS